MSGWEIQSRVNLWKKKSCKQQQRDQRNIRCFCISRCIRIFAVLCCSVLPALNTCTVSLSVLSILKRRWIPSCTLRHKAKGKFSQIFSAFQNLLSLNSFNRYIFPMNSSFSQRQTHQNDIIFTFTDSTLHCVTTLWMFLEMTMTKTKTYKNTQKQTHEKTFHFHTISNSHSLPCLVVCKMWTFFCEKPPCVCCGVISRQTHLRQSQSGETSHWEGCPQGISIGNRMRTEPGKK